MMAVLVNGVACRLMKLPDFPWNAKLLTFGLCCGAIAAVSLTPDGSDASSAADGSGKDIAALLAERSPGARPDGALISAKLASRAAATPRQYAMPRTRERLPPGGGLAHPLGNPGLIFPDDANAVPIGQASNVAQPVAFYPFPSGGSPPGDIVIPPTGSGLPGGPGPVPPSIPPIGPAVPEPATWMTLILGFGAIGCMIRAGRMAQHLTAKD